MLAHKLRLALTALAIVLGVMFVSGTFILTDTLHSTFSTLFSTAFANVDFQVRAKAAFTGNSGTAVRNPIPESILPKVAAIPGVEYANGSVSGYTELIAPNGKAVQNGGAPTLGFSFDPNSQLSPLHMRSGAPPTTSDDVAIDVGTANKYSLSVGERVRMLFSAGPRSFVISGLLSFGTTDNLAGATIAAFYLPTAQEIFNKTGQYDTINILAKPGADKAALQREIAAVLPPNVEVVSGQTVINEATSAIDSALGFFSTFLLIFAFIALFVGSFTIFNTFSIIVGQRTRELALLRILGASRAQLFRSVIAEALVVGLAASVIGLGLGVGAAIGLEAIMKALGITLPTGNPVFQARTAIVGLLVGTGVTVVSAIGPARRAVRIAPIAALAVQYQAEEESSLRRVIVGSAVGVAGIAALAVGLTLPQIILVGVGAVGIFVGAGMLAPLVARPMASFIGAPLARMLGVSGKLGRRNGERSPRRTAQTAAALMVGLALVSTFAVFGASISGSATSSINQAISATYIVTTNGGPGATRFSRSVLPTVQRAPGIDRAVEVYAGQFEQQSSVSSLTGVDPANLDGTIILNMVSGDGAAALKAGELLIDSTTANRDNLHVGSIVPVTFAKTGSSTMRVGGVFQPNALLGSFLVSDQFFQAHFTDPLPIAVLAVANGGPTAAGEAALKSALSGYPNLQVQTRAEFEAAQARQVNQLLGIVYVLLALAIVIALIGIVNTLMLSVFERTREIGLLRAVGMRRRQVRVMIRAEAVILSIFGAVLGVLIGTGLGVALTSSLREQGITDIVVPIPSLVLFLVISGVLGLAAASWPARRAAKLDVLTAIATE
jgi:putative ABC transport system permease protein